MDVSLSLKKYAPTRCIIPPRRWILLYDCLGLFRANTANAIELLEPYIAQHRIRRFAAELSEYTVWYMVLATITRLDRALELEKGVLIQKLWRDGVDILVL